MPVGKWTFFIIAHYQQPIPNSFTKILRCYLKLVVTANYSSDMVDVTPAQNNCFKQKLNRNKPVGK